MIAFKNSFSIGAENQKCQRTAKKTTDGRTPQIIRINPVRIYNYVGNIWIGRVRNILIDVNDNFYCLWMYKDTWR